MSSVDRPVIEVLSENIFSTSCSDKIFSFLGIEIVAFLAFCVMLILLDNDSSPMSTFLSCCGFTLINIFVLFSFVLTETLAETSLIFSKGSCSLPFSDVSVVILINFCNSFFVNVWVMVSPFFSNVSLSNPSKNSLYSLADCFVLFPILDTL